MHLISISPTIQFNGSQANSQSFHSSDVMTEALPFNLAAKRYNKSPITPMLMMGTVYDRGAGFADKRGIPSGPVGIETGFEKWEKAIICGKSHGFTDCT